MSAFLFDTLKFTEVLEATFTREQARNLTQAFVEATGDQIVTKADMLQLEQRLEARFDKIDARFDRIDPRFDESESSLKVEISLVKVDTVRWIVAAIVLNFGGIAALIFVAVKVFGK